MLDKEQLSFYRENGYLVVRDLFSRSEMDGLRAANDKLVEEARFLTENNEKYELEPDHSASNVKVRRLRCPLTSDQRFYDIARSPKVIDIIAQLVGPEVRLSHPNGKVTMKQAGFGAAIEWHQDWVGYPHTNEDLLAIGIPLDDVDADNAPMQVIPGSHKGPVYSHHNQSGTYVAGIDPVTSGIDFSKAVPLTCKAGDMTIHHVRMVHGSAANTSPKSRRLLLVQYAAVDAWPLAGVSDFDAFNAAIVRGKPTLRPRLEAVPVLLPTATGVHHVIYEAQNEMDHQFFTSQPPSSTVGAV